MVTKELIEEALESHVQWKKRLKSAIVSGKSEFNIGTISKDNVCQFGQWLYTVSQEEMKTEEFKKVQELHAEFHKVAGDILSLALAGKKEDAIAQLEFKSAYERVTGRLVFALKSWEKKIK